MAEMLYLTDKDKKCHHAVKKTDLLSSLLLKDRKTVLFVGEGNFTFTVAFAALREHEMTRGLSQRRPSRQPLTNSGKVWEGITTSRYEPAGLETEHQYVGAERMRCKSAPILPEVKLVCVSESVGYFQHRRRHGTSNEQSLTSDSNSCFERIRTISDLPAVPDTHCWQYGIDAGHLPPDLVRQHDVVWFQCPQGTLEGTNTATLLLSYLTCTAQCIASGGYVCVGIVKHPDYIAQYEIQEVLQGDRVGAWYSVVGGDEVLVRKVLEFGYRHEGKSDDHHYILDNHVTLVFQRK